SDDFRDVRYPGAGWSPPIRSSTCSNTSGDTTTLARGLSLDEIQDILILHEQRQTPCIHVLALLDQKLDQVDAIIKELDQVDAIIKELDQFRQELMRLRAESQVRLEQLPEEARFSAPKRPLGPNYLTRSLCGKYRRLECCG
ncbi:MAG: MerR family DNA-binding protein, partial [Dehalococcoidia bacterium]